MLLQLRPCQVVQRWTSSSSRPSRRRSSTSYHGDLAAPRAALRPSQPSSPTFVPMVVPSTTRRAKADVTRRHSPAVGGATTAAARHSSINRRRRVGGHLRQPNFHRRTHRTTVASPSPTLELTAAQPTHHPRPWARTQMCPHRPRGMPRHRPSGTAAPEAVLRHTQSHRRRRRATTMRRRTAMRPPLGPMGRRMAAGMPPLPRTARQSTAAATRRSSVRRPLQIAADSSSSSSRLTMSSRCLNHRHPCACTTTPLKAMIEATRPRLAAGSTTHL